jgi:hypothetical protein
MRSRYIAISLAAMAGCREAPASSILSPPALALAAAADHNQITVPLSTGVLVACANDGAGEWVNLTGELRITTFLLTDANGGVHVRSQYQPRGVTGTGAATGDSYRGTGVTAEHEYTADGGLPAVYTYINNFRIIGQGPGNNHLVHAVVHQTVNADGTVWASVDQFSAECR